MSNKKESKMAQTKPRGIRNNNPGNIRKSKDPWQGLAERQTDAAFFTFKSAPYGIRALARILISYQDKQKLRTIDGILHRWAPQTENNTAAYVAAVAESTGFAPDQTLDMHRFDDLKPLVEAIIQHENGQQPYTEAEITKGLVLAGVEPTQANLQASRTVQAGQVATAGTVCASTIEAVQQIIQPASDALLTLVPYLEIAKWLLLGVTLVGIGIMLWARIDDHRKGLR
jgi:hypothetical protein